MEPDVKVIKSPEKRGILLKRTTETFNSQERGALGNFLTPLIKVKLI